MTDAAPALEIGECFEGTGANAAHLNTVFGPRDGAVGVAWATALGSPSEGHVPFVAVLHPSVPVKPMTLFVSKAAPASDGHGVLIWGPAQAGVAGGVADAVADGTITAEQAETHVIVAAVWVNPHADDADAVYRNNRVATHQALRSGAEGLPELEQVLARRHSPSNPFYAAPTSGGEA